MAARRNKPHQNNRKKLPRFSRSALKHSVRIVHDVCCLAGAHSLIEDTRSEGAPNSLGSAIDRHDTLALFDWLIIALSYQGISNQAASTFIERNGSVTWDEITHHLSQKPSCPKLKS